MSNSNKPVFPTGFKIPYQNYLERNEELQIRAETFSNPILFNSIRDMLKTKNKNTENLIEKDRLQIANKQETVDSFVQNYTLSFIKDEILQFGYYLLK